MSTLKTKAYEFAVRLGQPRIWRHFAQYRDTQWLSRSDLERLQFERTRETLAFAYSNFPFYKRKFDAHNVRPADFKKLSDIEKFPVTSVAELKDAVRRGEFSSDAVQKIVALAGEKIGTLSTTGSTGTPFTFPINASAQKERDGCLLRTIEWYGHSLGKKNTRLWRTAKNKSFFDHIKQNVFGRRLELSIYDDKDPEGSLLSEEKIAGFVSAIREKKIRIVDGYVSALTLCADYINRNKIKDMGVESVVTGAEYLSPYSRKLIEKAFGCRVYNRYGGTEIGLMAHQCNQSNGEELHAMSDILLFEIIRDGKAVPAGQIGEVIITDFSNRAMPFIRFQVGDVATAADRDKICACGRGLHLMAQVEGRVNDVFVLPDGRMLVSHVWHKLFREVTAIREFRIVQKKPDAFGVQVVLDDVGFDLGPLRSKVQEFLPGCAVEWKTVTAIMPGPGGKFRHSISEVPFHLNEIRSNRIAPARNIGNIQPYRLATSDEAKMRAENSLKLDWNEGTVSPPASVVKKIQEAIASHNMLNWYPDIHTEGLREKIAAYVGTAPGYVEIFAGSDGALDYVAKTFVDTGDRVAIISPAYDQFRVSIEAAGGVCDFIYSKDPFVADISEFLPQIARDSKLIYLVNPNNPTGRVFDPADIMKLAKAFPDTIVVVDEAYIEFCPQYSSVPLLQKCSNIFILRTFSKAFCLAGLRIGYLLAAPEYLDLIRRIKNFKEINSLALVAADAALDAIGEYKKSIGEVVKAKAYFIKEAQKLGYEAYGKEGNFVILRVSDPTGFIKHLASHGIYVRDRSYMKQLDSCVRITIGTVKQMEKVVDAIGAYPLPTRGRQ
jgi:histidinol-phosphate aminotransferase